MRSIAALAGVASVLALMAAGCSTRNAPAQYTSVPAKSGTMAMKSDSKAGAESLQGSWKGKELSGDSDGAVTLKVDGNHFEFHGADQNEWYKGTFTLRDNTDPRQFLALIAECASPDYVGKTSKAIFRIKDGKLMLAARAPGSDEAPADFNDSESRKFEFTR